MLACSTNVICSAVEGVPGPFIAKVETNIVSGKNWPDGQSSTPLRRTMPVPIIRGRVEGDSYGLYPEDQSDQQLAVLQEKGDSYPVSRFRDGISGKGLMRKRPGIRSI